MSWNYRIIFSNDTYAIHEVYYKNNNIISWSENSISPMGDSIKELSEDIKNMKKAFDLPILQEINGKLIEIVT